MEDERSVRIIGVGAVCALGLNVKEVVNAVKDSGNEVQDFFSEKKLGNGKIVPAGAVKATDAELAERLGLTHGEGRRIPRCVLLGAVALREALEDAGIGRLTGRRIVLVNGTSTAGIDRSEKVYPGGNVGDYVYHDPGSATRKMVEIALRPYPIGVKKMLCVTTACSGAGNAIGIGCRMLRGGNDTDVVVTGGMDALTRFTTGGFDALHILSERAMKPLDEQRDGLNLGEGAGYVVMARGMLADENDYAEVAGFANVNEAYHGTASSPEGDGAFRAMAAALANAGVAPGEVDGINLHGTATPSNDAAEVRGVLRLFGKNPPKVSSVKGWIGHTLAASEGIEAALVAWGMKHGVWWGQKCAASGIEGVVPVAGVVRDEAQRTVVSNAFGFGGNMMSMVLKRCRERK